MAENDDPTATPDQGPDEGVPAPAEATAEQTAVAQETVPAAPAGPRFADRVWNFRAMVAVALAALLLGGGLGAAITAVSHDDGPDRHPGFARFGDGPPGFPGGPGGSGGFDRQQRQQFRHDLKDMRQRMKQRLEKDAPTPAPATPSPTKTS